MGECFDIDKMTLKFNLKTTMLSAKDLFVGFIWVDKISFNPIRPGLFEGGWAGGGGEGGGGGGGSARGPKFWDN